jgi:hypothetical protein
MKVAAWLSLSVLGFGGLGAGSLPAQSVVDSIVIYEGVNFTGRSEAVIGDWRGGGYWDRRISSVRVAPGYRMRLFDEPGFAGEELVVVEDWSPAARTKWVGRARSYRIERDVTPPNAAGVPTGYAESGYRGRLAGFTRDSPTPPFVVHSIRVPAGWRLTAYSQPWFRGDSITVTRDWSSESLGAWREGILSFRVHRPEPTPPR